MITSLSFPLLYATFLKSCLYSLPRQFSPPGLYQATLRIGPGKGGAEGRRGQDSQLLPLTFPKRLRVILVPVVGKLLPHCFILYHDPILLCISEPVLPGFSHKMFMRHTHGMLSHFYFSSLHTESYYQHNCQSSMLPSESRCRRKHFSAFVSLKFLSS